ncbi:hypothetical protein GIB67_031005 [Kingdonia uniflora]|uniref:Uncharacterized protein n=1 Tax=Kingdonia uniflora TaxID=39325 RepID=A0A7J7NG55_9MAGN|nr:hypothetical protein GIB67_031005 [Kingdonia uniflora]
MENMCLSKWLIKRNGIKCLLLQVRQAAKDGDVDRVRDILEGVHLSDESSTGASLTSNLYDPDNIFSHLSTAAHKPSNKKPRFHCLHCHEDMDNIIRHNGIKHWKLQFICEVPTCLNAYRDKVLLGTHMWFLGSLVSMFSVVLTEYIGAWCLGVGYRTAKLVEEENSNKWTLKVVPFVLLSVTGGVALSAIDDLVIYSRWKNFEHNERETGVYNGVKGVNVVVGHC